CIFFSIFLIQNVSLLLGSVALLQFLWPCQKQPFTNNTVFALAKTTSGEPGRSFLCRCGLYPSLFSNITSRISGEVCFPLILAIISERFVLVKTSATVPF